MGLDSKYRLCVANSDSISQLHSQDSLKCSELANSDVIVSREMQTLEDPVPEMQLISKNNPNP